MMRQVVELTRIRILQMLREPEVLFWVFGFPVMLAMILGLAFRDRGPEASRVGVLAARGADGDGASLEAHELLVVVQAPDAPELERLLATGAVDAVLEGDPPRLRLDPTRPEADVARLRVEAALQRAAGGAAPALEVAPVTARGSRYLDWLVPGLLGLSLMSTGIWGVGFALVEARQQRLIRRFLVTPMRREAFLLSYALSRLVLLVVEVALLVVFALAVLGVPFRGSLGAFAVLCLVGGLCFTGLGVLIGSRIRTPEAASGLIYLSMMPMGLASGVFFSYERFAEPLQPWIRALPLTALNDGLRAVMLEGAGLASLLPELGIQALWGAAAFGLGLALFRWS